MPKLYHNGQLEGWQIPGQQDPKASRVHVPSSPADLAAWLNHRRVGPTGAAAEQERRLEEFDDAPSVDELLEAADRAERQRPKVAGVCDSCGRSAAGALKLAQGNELDAIEQWMETAELWAIQQLVERARSVVRARGEALDGKGIQ
jgi:hypothetical protein